MREPKVADELDVVHSLVAEVGGIVVETETFVILHRFKRTLRRGDVERDFRRMHLKGEVHVLLVEGI